MATNPFKLIFGSDKGTLARLPKKERDKMARNAAAAAARLKAHGEFVTEVQDIRQRTEHRERLTA